MSMMDGDLETFGGEGMNDGADASEISGGEELTDGALALKAAPNTSATAITREQRRSRRKREIRARTISVKRMTKRELEIGRMLYPETDYFKPKTRVECADGPRPCPYVSCQHHLFLDVSARTGAIKLNFPDLEVWDMNETCALDVADRGGTTLEDVGAIMNLTRERIRQVEVKALAKLEALKDMSNLRDFVEEGPVGKRRLPVIAASAEVDDDDEDDDLEEDADDLDAEATDTDDANVTDGDATDGAPSASNDALVADFDGAE
jgi:Sigma-70, region 4